MATLRCNNCEFLEDGFCGKLGELIQSPLAKLFFGGAIDLLSESKNYRSECGVEAEEEKATNLRMEIIVIKEMLLEH